MAERRMFAKTIVLSDEFLDMPQSARCLYFTLSMFADDDGFVNSPRSIMRQCGASVDDIKILITKKFIISFDDGVIVIKHWRINNYLRNDRYKETVYKEHIDALSIDENGAYTTRAPSGIPTGIPSVGIPSIGKDRLGKVSIEDTYAQKCFTNFWEMYPRKMARSKSEKSFCKVCTDENHYIQIMNGLARWNDYWSTIDDKQFVPYPTTWLNQERWNDDVPQAAKHGTSAYVIKKPDYMNKPIIESRPATENEIAELQKIQQQIKTRMDR